MRFRRAVATGITCAATVAGLITAGAGTAAAEGGQAGLPGAVRLPSGAQVTKVERMTGVQVYTCTDGTWTFTEPRALGRSLTHSRGPVWQSKRDGSLVGAAKLAGAPSRPGSIELLLLRANRNEGTGELSDVDFVQRLDTRGGTPESARFPACTPELQGQTRESRYRATYTFAVQR